MCLIYDLGYSQRRVYRSDNPYLVLYVSMLMDPKTLFRVQKLLFNVLQIVGHHHYHPLVWRSNV